MEQIIIQTENQNQRLDKFLCERHKDFSRSHLQSLIEKGEVLVNGKIVKAGYSLKIGDEVCLDLKPPKPLEAIPQEVDFDIIFEDDDLIVINKPQGLVVHPCQSTKDGTLVNGLLNRIGNLSGINGVLRPGIVHRLDKDTAGLMIVAKNDFSHKALSQMIKDKEVKRKYLALLSGVVWENQGKIETFLARDKKDRKKYAVSNEGRKAISLFEVKRRFSNATLVEFSLITGRTHQIRVHSAYIGHPVVGDPIYGRAEKDLKGQLLFSYSLDFVHPRTQKSMHFQLPLPDYFENFISKLRPFEE